MNSIIILVLVAIGTIAIVSLLSLRDAFLLSPNRIDNPLFDINNEDLIEINKLQRDGKHEEAVSFAKELARKQPNNLYNRYILGLSYMKNYEYREAVFQFEGLLKHQPNHLDTRELLAECFINLKFYQRASLEYEYILKFNPNDLAIQRKAADIYMKIKQNRKAIDLYSKITMTDPEDTNSLGKLAELYKTEGELQKAIETLKFALKQDSNNLDFLINLANLYEKTNQTNEAIEINLKIEDNLDCNIPDQQKQMQEINTKLANLYAKKGSYSEALEYYNQVVTYDPNAWEEYGCNIAYIHFKEGRENDATSILGNLIETNPDSKDAVVMLAKMHIEKKDYLTAIKLCQEKLEKTIDGKLAYFYKQLISSIFRDWGMYLLESLGESEQALSKFAESLKYNSQDSEVYYYIAIINHKANDLTTAVSYLKKAIGLKPSCEKYHIAIAYIHSDLNNFPSAIESFDKAIALNPRNLEIKISKGVLLANNRRYTEAIELFSRILEYVDNEPDVYYNLALVYEYAQNITLAYKNYKKALEIDPDHTEAKNNLEILKNAHNL